MLRGRDCYISGSRLNTSLHGEKMSLIHKTVRKSNALVMASYRLSVYEQRIILACLSQIRRGEEVTDKKMYRVSAAEVAKASGVAPQTAYQRLKEATERLFDRQITILHHPNGGGPRKELVTRWIQTKATYTDGHVEVRFSADILPYLTELSKQFTKYRFGDVAEMSSTYAIRLYELIINWGEPGRREVDVDWLRDTFCVSDKYPAVKDFKKNVLEPAVQQVNKHSPVNVAWEQKKTGRKVTHIIFTFAPKVKAKQIQKKPDTGGENERMLFGFPKSVLDQAANPGETYQMVANRLKEST